MEINLNKEVKFRRAGFDMVVDTSNFTPEIIVNLFELGLASKVGDAASGVARALCAEEDGKAWESRSKADQLRMVREYSADATNAGKIADAGEAAMLKVIDALNRGEWTSRAPAADGLSADDAAFAAWCRDASGIAWKTKIEDWKDMTSAVRLRAIFDKLKTAPIAHDKLRKQFEALRAMDLDI